MTFGLTSAGFTRKKLTDIFSSMETKLKNLIDPALDTSPQSRAGQILGVVSEGLSEVWEQLEKVNASQSPANAEGFSLDSILDLNGLRRIGVGQGLVQAVMRGIEGTFVLEGNLFQQINTNESFSTTEDKLITGANVIRSVISVNFVAAGTYTVLLDGIPFSFLATGVESKQDILNDLESQIDSEINYSSSVDSSIASNPILIIDSDILIDAIQKQSFAVQITGDLLIDEIWTPILSRALNSGTFSIPQNSITLIQTAVLGLDEVNNFLTGTPGRNVETDDEARLRRKQSLRVTGAATVPAIEARIFQQVSGVTSVTVIDNRKSFPDLEGRPPHSFEAIVEGGIDQEIADKIWEVKAAGIETFGSITKQVPDSRGTLQDVSFSRPTALQITVVLEFDANLEELLPTNFEEAIKDAIVLFSISEQKVGDDVTVQRYNIPIYSIPGVGVITKLEMNKPAGTPTGTLIPMAGIELATFSDSNITVTKNP